MSKVHVISNSLQDITYLRSYQTVRLQMYKYKMPSNRKISLWVELESNQIQGLQKNPQFKVIHEHQQINKFQLSPRTKWGFWARIHLFLSLWLPKLSFEFQVHCLNLCQIRLQLKLLAPHFVFCILVWKEAYYIKCTDCRYNNVWLPPNMFLGCRAVALWSLRKLWDLIEPYQFLFDFAFHLQAA